MAAETSDIVCALIADVCAIDRSVIRADSRLIGLGLDSVRLLDLILGIETEFGLVVNESDPELGNVESVADLVAFVERRRAAAR